MNARRILQWAVAAAVAGGLPAGLDVEAQQDREQRSEQQSPDRPSGDIREGRNQPPAQTDQEARSREGGVKPVNRATYLIGSPVRNAKGETVGLIADIVIDLERDRVAYAVLDYKGRNIPLPMSSLQISRDGANIILWAEPERLDRVPGFQDGEWPPLRSPESAPQISGGPPDSLSGRYRSGYEESERQRYREGEIITGGQREAGRWSSPYEHYRPERDDPAWQPPRGQSRLRLKEDRPESGSSAAPRQSNRDQNRSGSEVVGRDRVFRGEIVSIDPERRIMTVEGREGTRTFTFSDRPALVLKETRNPRIIDLKVGYPVSVTYREGSDGRYVAHRVIRTDTP